MLLRDHPNDWPHEWRPGASKAQKQNVTELAGIILRNKRGTCIDEACFFISSAAPMTGDAVSSTALTQPPSSRLLTTTFCISCSRNSCSARRAACSAARRARFSASSRVIRPLDKHASMQNDLCAAQRTSTCLTLQLISSSALRQ